MNAVNLTIPAGLPFGRLVRVVGGKTLWPTLDAFEIRSQLRKNATAASTLIANLHDYMTASYGTGEQANDIEIVWSMTGAQTRAIDANGYYDLVLSDPGPTDARALQALSGRVQFTNLVTTAEDES